jgi:hypothetical protein
MIVGLVASLAVRGLLSPGETVLLLGDGAIAGATVTSLACWGVRFPGGAVLGGLGYLLGVLMLVVPHLVLAVHLAVLRELGPETGSFLVLAWLLTKLLFLAASLVLGTYLPLVYCREWIYESPWIRPWTKS